MLSLSVTSTSNKVDPVLNPLTAVHVNVTSSPERDAEVFDVCSGFFEMEVR